MKIQRFFCWTVFFTGVQSQAFAFDPYTISAGIQAASSLMSTMDKAAEAGVNIADLLVELELDPTADQEVERLTKKLSLLKDQFYGVKSISAQTQSLLDLEAFKAKSHADKIRHITKMTKMLKKISGMFAVTPRAAEKAAQVQQTQLSYLMLEELMAMRRAQFLAYVDSQELKVRREASLQKILLEEKVHPRKSGLP